MSGNKFDFEKDISNEHSKNFELGVGVQNYSVDFVAAIYDHDFGQNPVDIFSDTLILRENCPNTELFLVRNFPHSD